MKNRLIFSLSVAVIFLSAGVFTYSQDKPNTAHNNTKQTQKKQVAQTSKPHQVKTISLKPAKVKTTNKKIVEKPGKVKSHKVIKKETKKVEDAKVLKHHKKMEKKIQKKQSDRTSEKK